MPSASGSQSVSDGIDLGFRPSQALTKRLQESPTPGSTFDISVGWYPEDMAQLAAFCGQPAVLQVLVNAFDHVTETDDSNNVASVAVRMVNCPGTDKTFPIMVFRSGQFAESYVSVTTMFLYWLFWTCIVNS